MTRLELRGISVVIGGHALVDHASFALTGDELLGVIGPNGAGKSTLLRVAAGIAEPASGAALLDGKPLASSPPRERARRISYLPQGGMTHWPLTVARLVALGRLPHLEPFKRAGAGDEAAIAAALEACGMTEFAQRAITSLSGGERALALFARALAVGADVLIADEPAASLDPNHQLQVMEILKAQAGQGRAIAVVMHDLSMAARFCDRLILLDRGRIAASGAPDAVLTDANLRAVYAIEAARGNGEMPYVLPLRRIFSSQGQGTRKSPG